MVVFWVALNLVVQAEDFYPKNSKIQGLEKPGSTARDGQTALPNIERKGSAFVWNVKSTAPDDLGLKLFDSLKCQWVEGVDESAKVIDRVPGMPVSNCHDGVDTDSTGRVICMGSVKCSGVLPTDPPGTPPLQFFLAPIACASKDVNVCSEATTCAFEGGALSLLADQIISEPRILDPSSPQSPKTTIHLLPLLKDEVSPEAK